MSGDLWDTTRELQLIRDFAHSRMLSADAVLGAVLARIAALVPPTVMLPAVVGVRSPLSFYAGAVAPSSGGKTAALLSSHELIGNPAGCAAFAQVGMGSGEGIIEQLKTDENGVRTAENLLIEADEIGGMFALMGRNGATLADVLKKGWSGALLHNANRRESGKVEAHSYALGVFVGVQPRAAHELLEATGDGFFQRFVFFRGNDETVPADCREPVERLQIRIPQHGDLAVCGPIREQLRSDRLSAVRNTDLADVRIDGHRNLSRFRLAALLSILHGAQGVDMPDWDLAGVILERSDQLVAEMRSVIAKSRADAALAGAGIGIELEARKTDLQRDADIRRIFDALADDDMTRSEVLHLFRLNRRTEVSEVFDDLVTAGALGSYEQTALGGKKPTTKFQVLDVSRARSTIGALATTGVSK